MWSLRMPGMVINYGTSPTFCSVADQFSKQNHSLYQRLEAELINSTKQQDEKSIVLVNPRLYAVAETI